MKIQKRKINTQGIKFYIKEKNKEIARAYLYVLKNDLHEKPFGFIEDLFVDENYRGQGYGTKIIKALLKKAKRQGCYKLIANSRLDKPKVHELYKRLGFIDWGKEFRKNI